MSAQEWWLDVGRKVRRKDGGLEGIVGGLHGIAGGAVTQESLFVVCLSTGGEYWMAIKDWEPVEPVSAKWNGTGLPPVGTVCEYYWAAGDSWRSGTCVAHFNGRAVICDVDDEDCAERLYAHHVRPIRTTEQIAAEEREMAVREMQALDPHNMTLGMLGRADFCRALYDAGYRKPKDL